MVRVSISSGTKPAIGSDSARPSYTASAIVPADPWLTINEIEEQTLVPSDQFDGAINDFVAIISFPKELRCTLQHLSNEVSRSTSAIHYITESRIFREALDELHGFLISQDALPQTITSLGVVARQPNMVTTTVNTRLHRRNGLHLDNWDGLCLHDLKQSRSRLSVNLGKGPRYFLFVNIPLPKMACEMVENNHSGTDLGRSYLQEHPTCPVYRLRIDPGEAYLAPTDYVLHDATTLGKREKDIHLSILARIASKKILNAVL